MTHPILKCNPGDIVDEKLGESLAARYIIIDKEIHTDYRDLEYLTYVAVIIYTCSEWSTSHKPGMLWNLDSQPITSAITYEVTFKSPLKWNK